jgi:hypothetical protein
MRADKTTKRSNIVDGDSYKILIPKEFGGGFIKDHYQGYGRVLWDTKDNMADLYGILAYWNKHPNMIYDGDKYPSTMEDILTKGKTGHYGNRWRGINISRFNGDIDKLKYPLKLVSASYKGTYEDCEGRSYSDPNHGFFKTYWE